MSNIVLDAIHERRAIRSFSPEMPPRETRTIDTASPFAGATVVNISPATIEEFSLSHAEEGVAVIGVEDAPKEPAERISLTISTLNRSDQVWFLANGEEKADAISRALDGDEALPASHVHGDEATLWFIDEAAAGGLPEPYICAL